MLLCKTIFYTERGEPPRFIMGIKRERRIDGPLRQLRHVRSGERERGRAFELIRGTWRALCDAFSKWRRTRCTRGSARSSSMRSGTRRSRRAAHANDCSLPSLRVIKESDARLQGSTRRRRRIAAIQPASVII